jgi:hypothetical protein
MAYVKIYFLPLMGLVLGALFEHFPSNLKRDTFIARKFKEALT